MWLVQRSCQALQTQGRERRKQLSLEIYIWINWNYKITPLMLQCLAHIIALTQSIGPVKRKRGICTARSSTSPALFSLGSNTGAKTQETLSSCHYVWCWTAMKPIILLYVLESLILRNLKLEEVSANQDIRRIIELNNKSVPLKKLCVLKSKKHVRLNLYWNPYFNTLPDTCNSIYRCS